MSSPPEVRLQLTAITLAEDLNFTRIEFRNSLEMVRPFVRQTTGSKARQEMERQGVGPAVLVLALKAT
jgi:hypothetical protein